MRYTLALLVMLLVGCGAEPARESLETYTKVGDDTLKALFGEFLDAAEVHGLAVSVGSYPSAIEWAEQDGAKLAECNHNGASITMDPWLKGRAEEARYALWHELGHCVFRLAHSQRIGSIMAYKPKEGKQEDWATLSDEFFAAVK